MVFKVLKKAGKLKYNQRVTSKSPDGHHKGFGGGSSSCVTPWSNPPAVRTTVVGTASYLKQTSDLVPVISLSHRTAAPWWHGLRVMRIRVAKSTSGWKHLRLGARASRTTDSSGAEIPSSPFPEGCIRRRQRRLELQCMSHSIALETPVPRYVSLFFLFPPPPHPRGGRGGGVGRGGSMPPLISLQWQSHARKMSAQWKGFHSEWRRLVVGSHPTSFSKVPRRISPLGTRLYEFIVRKREVTKSPDNSKAGQQTKASHTTPSPAAPAAPAHPNLTMASIGEIVLELLNTPNGPNGTG